MCRRMLGSNPGQLQLALCLSDALTTRLDLIHKSRSHPHFYEGSDPSVSEVPAGCTLHSFWGCTEMTRWAFLTKALIPHFLRLLQAVPFTVPEVVPMTRWAFLMKALIHQFLRLLQAVPFTVPEVVPERQGEHFCWRLWSITSQTLQQAQAVPFTVPEIVPERQGEHFCLRLWSISSLGCCRQCL